VPAQLNIIFIIFLNPGHSLNYVLIRLDSIVSLEKNRLIIY
jgi:hypothetical protein